MRPAHAADIPSGMGTSDKPPIHARFRSGGPGGVTAALAAAAIGVVLPLAAPAHAQSPMIQGWLAANAACKGGPGDDPKTQQACETRDRLSGKLKRRGCVYHEDGDWWKCRR